MLCSRRLQVEFAEAWVRYHLHHRTTGTVLFSCKATPADFLRSNDCQRRTDAILHLISSSSILHSASVPRFISTAGLANASRNVESTPELFHLLPCPPGAKITWGWCRLACPMPGLCPYQILEPGDEGKCLDWAHFPIKMA